MKFVKFVIFSGVRYVGIFIVGEKFWFNKIGVVVVGNGCSYFSSIVV